MNNTILRILILLPIFSVASGWTTTAAGVFPPDSSNTTVQGTGEVAAQEPTVHTAMGEQLTQMGFTPLFNGRDLTGWKNPFDHGNASVVDQEIHLVGEQKFFLVTEKSYANFELIAEIKLPQGPANSGIMFRCHVEPNRVFGYQAECDGSPRRWSAGLYDEGRRQWIWPSTTGRSEAEFLKYEAESQAHFAKPEIRDALKRDDWNRYVVNCRGDQITISLNGVLVTDLHDTQDQSGFLGIQHHGEKGQTYQFRNLFIREID